MDAIRDAALDAARSIQLKCLLRNNNRKLIWSIKARQTKVPLMVQTGREATLDTH